MEYCKQYNAPITEDNKASDNKISIGGTMFDEAFLHNLPEDPIQAAHEMSRYFLAMYNQDIQEDFDKSYPYYINGYAAIEAFIEAFGLPIESPKLEGNKQGNMKMILQFVNDTYNYLDRQISDGILANARHEFRQRFGVAFLYQFSDGDVNRIQQLLNELRGLIAKSELFEAKHKQRILEKLENLQKELHKKVSSLDKFWGLIGEAGVVLGKFGKDAKPFVDRIREIAQIAWRTQARAEELPSGTSLPLLTSGEPTKEE